MGRSIIKHKKESIEIDSFFLKKQRKQTLTIVYCVSKCYNIKQFTNPQKCLNK